MADDTTPRLSLAAAARASGLDRATVRRRLLAHGVKIDTYRAKRKGAKGPGEVLLPVPLLLEAGVPVGRPSPPDAPAPPAAALLDLERERGLRLAAEARVAGLEATLAATRETVDALQQTLRMLEPPRRPPDAIAPESAPDPRRRRWLTR